MVEVQEAQIQEISAFVENLINCDVLDECFSGFVKNGAECEAFSQQALQNRFEEMLQNISKDSSPASTKYLIDSISNIINYNQSQKLFSLLEHVMHKNILDPKLVCQCILWTQNFQLNNEVFWVNGLKFIRKIIHLVKYKGVRDILALLLSKIPQIPLKSPISISKQINALHNLIQYILDRDSALLPAYFVLDEIQKKSIYWQKGHWKFSRLISSFIDSFRPVAKMASISGRPTVLPIIGYFFQTNFLKLDQSTARYKLKGLLPYDKELNEPQLNLLLYILEQNNSREAIVNILSLNRINKTKDSPKDNLLKKRNSNTIIKNLLIELYMSAVIQTCHYESLGDFEHFQKLDFTDSYSELNQIIYFWNHISTNVLYFEFLCQNIEFNDFMADLYKRIGKEIHSMQISKKLLLKCREFFMWALLQVVSSSIHFSSPQLQQQQAMANNGTKMSILSQFEPIFNFIDLFYPENEPLPLPDFSKQNCIYIMSAASIWILITKKAEAEFIKFTKKVPAALKQHVEYLQEIIVSNSLNTSSEFLLAILCNSYSVNTECYSRVFRYFQEILLGRTANNNSGIQNQTPISMTVLDSFTPFTKSNLVSHISNHFINLVKTKSFQCCPGLTETYCRLMVYNEIEAIGISVISSFLNQLLNSVLHTHSWNLLYTLLEMFSFRFRHVNCVNQIQFLRLIYSRSIISQINNVQLYSCMENTALKVIRGLDSSEFINFCTPIMPLKLTDLYNFLPSDSEELNKIFVLTLARSIHITGTEILSGDMYTTWVNDILSSIQQNLNTNLYWPSYTLKCFPTVISKFYQISNANQFNLNQEKEKLKRSVEEEYRKWKSMTNESDMVIHFTSQSTQPLFYCLLFKMILENEPINLVAYKILDRIGIKSLSAHLRTFCDFLVTEFSNSRVEFISKSQEALNDLIWKFHIITLDRLLLCFALRSFDGNEAQVMFFIIQSLLLQFPEFRDRVNDFVRENSPEHWKEHDYAEKQALFQRKHPEKYYFEHLQDVNSNSNLNIYLPSLFNNICLRILPVFDIIIHRIIESSAMQSDKLDQLLDTYGCLYKFHDQPITFLYNTFHYYEANLRDKSQHKRKLVYTIINAFKDVKPPNWAVTETFLNYCQKNNDDWKSGPDYFKQLVGRLVDTLSSESKCPFPTTDYRFNEFQNVGTHALYVTCVEILALPGKPSDISNSLINVVLNNHKYFPRQDIELWINATALIFTALPDSYSCVIMDRIIEFMEKPQFFYDKNMSYLVDFKNSHLHINEYDISYLIALSHAYWNHGSLGQISTLPQFIKDRIKPIIQTEEQFIFVCFLIGPFLYRFSIERTRCVMDITIELYEMLEIIDKKIEKFQHMDMICDLLYHIKYMFTGDNVKREIEGPILKMRPELRKKLRFISNIAFNTTTEETN